MAIDIYSESIDFVLERQDVICVWLQSAAREEGFKLGDISIIFCSDEYILQVNKQYLDHDYYTDIITFDYSLDNVISGDLFISIDRVRENAIDFKQTFNYELNRILIHGVMHLCGYHDKEPVDKVGMTLKEDYYLNKLIS